MRRYLHGRVLPVGTVAVGMVSLALVAGCEVVQEDESEFYIDVAPVEVRDMRITAEATGELEPVLKVEVKSKASGEILDLFADSGDEVEQGTVLAEIDPRDVNNAYNGAMADREVAVARMEIAEAQLERSRTLLAEDVISQQEFEQRELEHANSRASLVRAETNLELAQLRRNDVKIAAPMNGTILEKLVEFGQVIQSATQNVSGGTTLFMMANLDDMRVRTLVDETDVGQLSAGMPATVTVEAFADRTFEGFIEKIEPQAVVQQNITMFPVIVLLDNRSGLLKPGMNAEVEVLVDERHGTLAVPNNAVVQPQELAPAAEVLGMDPQSASIDPSVWGPLMAEAAQKNAAMRSEPSSVMAAAGPGRGGWGAMAGNGAGAAPGSQPGATSAPAAAAPGADETGGMTVEEIRAAIQSGEISRDSAIALFSAMPGSGGGQQMAGGRQGGGRQANGGQPGGRQAGNQQAGDQQPGGQNAAGGQQAGGQQADGARAGGGQRGGAGRQGGGQRGGGQGGMFGGMGGFGGGFGGMMAAMGGSSGDAAYKPAVAFVVGAEGGLEPRAVILGISDWDFAEVLAGLREGEELALIGPAQLQARQQARVERMTRRMQPFGGGR